MHTGSCLCGAVRFEVDSELKDPDACHCTQCRRQSGHYWVSVNVPRDKLTLHGAENVTWFRSSEKVRRGFCAACGSVMFWDPLERDWTSISMGSFDTPTGAHLHKHIFVAHKGDYYDIADGLPQFQDY